MLTNSLCCGNFKMCHYFREYARWARLGELNYLTDTDDARPKDYKIVQRVIHPDYKYPMLYNDIALFRLEEDVTFSPYVRPICLNADPYMQSTDPQKVMATGWGQTYQGWFVFLGFKSYLPMTVYYLIISLAVEVNKSVRNKYIDKYNTAIS